MENINFKNILLRPKVAYGYDTSGEITGGSEDIANRENQKNINDTAQPQDQHKTPSNPANIITDSEADEDFPEFFQDKYDRVMWPPRN